VSLEAVVSSVVCWLQLGGYAAQAAAVCVCVVWQVATGPRKSLNKSIHFSRTWKVFENTIGSISKKVAHTRLPSVGFRSWSRFLAVSLQVEWVINPTVGCRYFLPGLQLPLQPLRGLLPVLLLVNRGTTGLNSLPKTVTWQRRDCDLNPGPSAPESSTLTTGYRATLVVVVVVVY